MKTLDMVRIASEFISFIGEEQIPHSPLAVPYRMIFWLGERGYLKESESPDAVKIESREKASDLSMID